MSLGSSNAQDPDRSPLRAWSDCDFFCIQHYASAGMEPCGWRGRLLEARRDASGTLFLCPRCGGATLLRIPLEPAEHEGSDGGDARE